MSVDLSKFKKHEKYQKNFGSKAKDIASIPILGNKKNVQSMANVMKSNGRMIAPLLKKTIRQNNTTIAPIADHNGVAKNILTGGNTKKQSDTSIIMNNSKGNFVNTSNKNNAMRFLIEDDKKRTRLYGNADTSLPYMVNQTNKMLDEKRTKENSYVQGEKTTQEFFRKNNILPTFEENETKEKEQKNDFARIASQIVASGKKTGYNLPYAIQTQTLNNSNSFKGLSKQISYTQHQREQSENLKNGLGYSLPTNKDVLQEDLKAKRDMQNEIIQKNIESANTKVGRKLLELLPSMTNSAIGAGVSVINPGLGAATFMEMAYADYFDDAKQRGLSDKKAHLFGTIMSAWESASESLITGQQLSAISKAATGEAISKDILESFATNIAENGIQEALTEPLQEATAQLLGGEYDFENLSDNMLSSGIDGAIMGAIMGGASAGIQSAVTIVNKINKNQKVTSDELINSLQEVTQSEDVNLQDNLSNLTNNLQNNQQIVENNSEKSYNNIKLGETKNISTQELMSLHNEGGYRTNEQITNLRESIERNGITEPIEISKRNDGTYEIENGNHRLQIANELGIANVPVKLVDSWENVGTNRDIIEKDKVNDIEGGYDGRINGIRMANSNIDEGRRSSEGRLHNSTEQSQNRGTTEGNVGIFEGTSNSDQQTSNVENEGNNRKIENPNEGSFSMQENITDMYREEMNQGKNRKHYKTVFESESVGKIGKQASKELFAKDTYVPVSNQKTITEVNDKIGRIGEENSYTAFRAKIANNEKVTLQDIATGEKLIQIYSQQGDYSKVQDLIQDVAILGTELGQQVQALSLIKKMSPEGQLQYLNKLVERTNIKEKADIKVTDEMAKKILESKSQEDLENNLTEVAIQIGEQIPITTRDKIRSWRYLSMLGNPKTHIKNVGANVAMNITQNVKNTIAGGMEDVVSIFNKNMERTKTLKHSTDEQIDFARKDAEYMKDLIDGGGKYDIKNVIQNSKKQFDNKTLNAIAEFNSNALDVEDKVFLKLAYSQSLANYMTANKLKPSDMTGKILEEARQYASFQAQEATFHQFSALANSLNAIENRGGVGGKTVEAVLPFKKTPINIAKAGVEYSPIGLAKSLTFDLDSMWNQTDEYRSMLEQGKITQEEYNSATSKLLTKQIDNMAKGLTGTSLAVIGYFLAQSGILKAGNDGEDDEFEEKMGKQEYSLQIGDYTYSLDWISPSAIPLFVGATVQQLLNSEEENKDGIINSTLTAGAKAFEPMTEMSMLQSLTSAISSYEQGSSSMIFDLGASAISSYAGQFVPTALGQIARTIDPYERDTTSTKKGMEKKVDQFVKQQINKVPGLSQMLPIKQDVWGEDKKREDNIGMRFLTNTIFPYNRKKVIEDVTNTELLSVFRDTGEKGILPGAISKNLTINKEEYRLTAREYNEAKKQFGSKSKKILDDLIKSSSYKELNPEQRAKAIKDVYSYTKEDLKKTYANHKKVELKTSNLYNTVKRIEDENGKLSSYFEYHSQIDGMKKDSEKIKCLSSITTDTKTKSIIYEEYLMDKAEEGEQTQYEKLKEYYKSEKIIDQYLDYKVKANDTLEELKKSGKKKEGQSLNDKECTQLLADSKYSKEQTEALYVNVIASESNQNKYEILKSMNKGNSIDAYLKFILSDRESDKEEDGTKSGKSINGTRKKKVVNTINSLNINKTSKIYLLGTEFNLNTNIERQNYNTLLSYIKTLDKSEQVKIVKTLNGKTEMKDGSYNW